MKILFNLEYQTSFGEELVLNILNECGETELHKLDTVDGKHWSYMLLKPVETGSHIDYYYTLMRGDELLRSEWQTEPHRLEFAATKATCYTVYDHWLDIPEDAYMYSSAFTECIMCCQREMSAETDYQRTVRLKVRAPQPRIGEQLGLVGGCDALGRDADRHADARQPDERFRCR